MSEAAISDSLSIQTIRGDGTAPKRRLATPEAALLAYQEMRQIEMRRDLRFNALAGIFNGLPPTSPEEMEEMGIGDMPNINTKQFESKIKAYVDNWTSVNAAGDEWFEVEAEHEDPMEQERRSKYLTKFFNAAIKKWEGDDEDFVVGRHYVVKSAARDTQMGIYGIGVAHWPDHIDFRWNTRPTRKVLVPEGVNLLLDNCPFLAIEDDISVPDLWAMRKLPGWNEEAIAALLYLNTCRSNTQMSQYFTWAEWQERVRENDTWMYSDFPLVRIVHVYVKEFSSTPNKANITHCVISDAYPVLSGLSSEQIKKDVDAAKKKVMSWLYEKTNVATRWGQVVSVFSDNSGPEGKWHGVKGFGDLIFDGCHFNNLMFNRTACSAIIANLPMFQGGTDESAQKMKQLKIGFAGILNPGLQIEQFQIKTDINAAMAMFNLGTSIVNTNSRQFPMGEQSGSEAPTATQINFERADEARFTNLQIMFYRATGLDPIGAEMYRRIAQPGSKYPESWPGGNIAKRFRKQCAEVGIPENELLKIRSVRANRNVGTGNMGLDIMQADQLLSIATPGQGQLNARYKKACALVGPDAARAFVEMEQAPPNFQTTVIDLENLSIQNGQTPTAIGSQPHEQHLGMPNQPGGHLFVLAGAEQIANQMLEAGLENNIEAANRLFRVLQSGVEHSYQHVQFLASVPRMNGRKGLNEEVVRDLNKMLNDFAQFTEAFGEALQKAQEAANPQAGMSPEMMKAQQQMQIDQAKAANDIEIRKAQAAAKMQNDLLKTQFRGNMQLQDHEYKMGLKANQDAQGLQSQAAKNAQELRKQQLSAAIDIGAKTVMTEQEIQKRQMMEAEEPTETTE